MSTRGQLLRAFLDRDLSKNTQLQISATLRNMTDQQKEERAGQILTILQNSKDEQSFLLDMERLKMI